MGSREPSVLFYFLVFVAEVLLFGVLILSLVWAQYYRDGFAWKENPEQMFYLHPVLMITGFIFLMGHAMLVYRLFSNCCGKGWAKFVHSVLHLMAVPCIVVGAIAVFEFHDLAPQRIPHLYSLHSWLGLVTMGLFALQLLVGFFSFWVILLCEQATSSFRRALVPIHTSFGIVTFMLAVATCVSGYTEKAFFTLSEDYVNLPDEAYFINAQAVALAGLAILMGFLLRRNVSVNSVAPNTTHHYVMSQKPYYDRENNM